jgi:hypothetical protein
MVIYLTQGKFERKFWIQLFMLLYYVVLKLHVIETSH